MEQITLYYRQGASDKVYQAQIEPKAGGFIVTFAFGRRGSTLQTGTKTTAPVSHDAAARIFQKLVQEKQAKGYTPGEDGTPYQHTEQASQATGVQCQLLNAVEEDTLPSLIADSAWCMQEKFDGRRMLIRKSADGEITGINRKGLVIAIPVCIADEARKIAGACLLDGECIGDRFHAFDALIVSDEDSRRWPYQKRLFAVGHLLAACNPQIIAPVLTRTEPNEKRAFFEQLKGADREGVVFKRLSAPYTGGRPASSGDQLKFKFCASASFIVVRINAKRSVSLILRDGDKVKPAGNVTIPPNCEIPGIGKVVDVRYLHAFRESGHVYQPVYLGEREDISSEECTVAQLKFKAAEAEDEEAA